MQAIQTVFKRYEQKYVLTEEQTARLRAMLANQMTVDRYGETTITSLYFDTPDDRLVRASLEKPIYKEKLRLRCYGVPQEDSPAFIELKKKYRGIVYKRRVTSVYARAMEDLCTGRALNDSSQIAREINWFRAFYGTLQPRMVLSYDRIALYCPASPNLRMTFDRAIRWRSEQFALTDGAWGAPLLEPGQRLLEIKIPQAMPLWMSRALAELQIYPASFSKYGRAYQTQLQTKQIIRNGGSSCA